MTRLADLGERRILREIIPRFVSGAGDDCAVMTMTISGKHLVITTDPAPHPAAEVIGNDSNPYWLGWLLVTINASDIAASGARPLAFVAALDLPSDYLVADLERLLQGISESCLANGLKYVGGNLRESAAVSAVGTAIGFASVEPLTRRGAQAGDAVVVFGDGGRFWSDVARLRAGEALDKVSSPLFAPKAQTNVIWELHELNLLRCGMDTSDGFAPTLEELALANDLAINIDVDRLADRHNASSMLSRPEVCWFGWGDWTVVSAVSPDRLGELEKVAKLKGFQYTLVGRFEQGQPQVILSRGGAKLRARRLESERFVADSWFKEGVGAYERRLMDFQLP